MNVLAIGAHFDDIELGCAGTLLRHVDAGDRVLCFVATNSGYVNPDGIVVREEEVARREGQQAAGVLGVELICGGLATLELQPTEELIALLRRVIESNSIHCLYTHWPADVHQDHRAVGVASLSAGRHVPRFLTYRSNYYDSTVPFCGNFYVDITGTFERKLRAIKAHRSELRRVGNRWIEHVRSLNRSTGLQVGVRYAENFEVVRFMLDAPLPRGKRRRASARRRASRRGRIRG